jgi:uncharacterized membrane protein
MGGVIYSIITLLFLQTAQSETGVLSATIGVVIAIICLAVFVRFLYYVSSSIQVDRLINTLTNDILQLVKKIEHYYNAYEGIRSDAPDDLDYLTSGECIRINADSVGYIQNIHDMAMTQYADKHNYIIRVEKMIGDYVTKDTVILSVWSENKEINAKDLLKFIVIGKERNTKQDIEFGLLKLTEVALKALSPGINDPNTAIYCIKQLGMILSQIGKANLENTYYYNKENRLKLIFEDVQFEVLLYRVFFQIRHYGANDVSIAVSIIQALVLIAEGNRSEIKEKVWEFASYILDIYNRESLADLDRKYLNKELARLAIITGNSGSEIYIKQTDKK